jgi:hypothetical protein
LVDPAEYRVSQYTRHHVTLAHGEENTWPVGYYTDKVALGKHEFLPRLSWRYVRQVSHHTVDYQGL